MTYAELFPRLTEAFRHPLPGADAQTLMAPRPRGGWPAGVDPAHVRHAAGLLLVFAADDGAHVVLTVRSERVRHSGQVSLPGGVVEPGETIQQAALREAHEEVAFRADDVIVMGLLTPLDIPVSGFRLHPVVGALDRRPHLAPSDEEVARILEIPLRTLLDPATVQWVPMARNGVMLDVPAFTVGGAVIWGATAMVLAEFLTLLGWAGPSTH